MPDAWCPGAPSKPTAMRGSASRQPRISCGESMPLRAGWLARNSASSTRRCRHRRRQEVHAGDGQCLVGRGRRAGVRDDAVEGVLELLEHGHLVASRVDEDGAVLGARDVPLEALEDQGVADLVAGGDDVRVHLVDADLGVRDAAVVGDDHPVQAVRVGVPYLVDHPVLRVAAVLRVDVVVAGQPQQAVGPRVTFARSPARRGGVGGRSARSCEDARRSRGGASAGHTGPSQKGPSRQVGRGKFGIGDVGEASATRRHPKRRGRARQCRRDRGGADDRGSSVLISYGRQSISACSQVNVGVAGKRTVAVV